MAMRPASVNTRKTAGPRAAKPHRKPQTPQKGTNAGQEGPISSPGKRPGWDLKGMMTDERRKVSLLRGKLQEKEEELEETRRKLRQSSDSVADFEKMMEDLYTRLEAKEAECRELREETTKSREQIGRLSTTLDSLRREHDSLVSSADSLTEQLMKQKREQVQDTVQLYVAQLPSTLHKYRYIELQNKLDALFVTS